MEGVNASIPLLKVRKGHHNNYDRLVFDWTRPVEYEVSRDGIRVTVRFNRLARINVEDLKANLNRGFSNPSASTAGPKLIFSVDASKGARLRHFRSGTKVVLDVFRGLQPKTAENVPDKIKAAPLEAAASALPPSADKPIRLLVDSDEKKTRQSRTSKKENKKQVTATQNVKGPQLEKSKKKNATSSLAS